MKLDGWTRTYQRCLGGWLWRFDFLEALGRREQRARRYRIVERRTPASHGRRFYRRTVRALCPPSRRSLRGGRRK
jgi:hypothetical protein